MSRVDESWSDRRRELAAVLALNAVPVLGVFVLGWSLSTLVLLYWFEIGVTLCFAAIRAVFAQRPPEHDPEMLLVGAFREKPWQVPLPKTDLGGRVANVPLLLALATVLGVLDRAVRYLPMEYRIGRDAVGYDRVADRTVRLAHVSPAALPDWVRE